MLKGGMRFVTVQVIFAEMKTLPHSDDLDLYISYKSLYQSLHLFSKQPKLQGFEFEGLSTVCELLTVFRGPDALQSLGFKLRCLTALRVPKSTS